MHKTYNRLIKYIEYTLVVIFALLVISVLLQVFGRYVLNESFSWTEEFARFSLIWLSVLGAAYLNGKREHLTIDYFLKKLPNDRLKKRSMIIEWIMLLFAMVVMVVGGVSLVYTTLLMGQKSPAMDVLFGLVYLVIPISGLLIMFFTVYNMRNVNQSITAQSN